MVILDPCADSTYPNYWTFQRRYRRILQLTTSKTPDQQPGLHHLLTMSNFSSLNRLVNVTAYMKRFIRNCREQAKQTGPLTVKERDEASLQWINA